MNPKVQPLALGRLINIRRRAAGLSRAALAIKTNLSESTLKNLEAGRHKPSQVTLKQILAVPELKLTPAELFSTGEPDGATAPLGEASPMNCLILPGFDPIAMAHDLSTRLAGHGGAIEQSYLYLDTKSAACWFQIANQSHYSNTRDLAFLHELSSAVRELVGPDGLDVIGLGCGDGRKEVRLVQHLSAGSAPGKLVLYLLDISQPLLGYAFKNAVESLSSNASVFAIQGNFHHLPFYTQLLHTPAQSNHRRLLCLFGGTFGNLDNEVRFVRDNLVGLSAGDLLLLHVSSTFGPRQQPEIVQQQDPMLAGSIPPDLQSLIREWLTGPIERYSRPVGAPLPQMEVQARFDTAACPVPGSYAVEHVVLIHAPPAQTKRFTVAYVKRYDAQGLAGCMDELGWEPLRIWDREMGNMLLGLFRRR